MTSSQRSQAENSFAIGLTGLPDTLSSAAMSDLHKVLYFHLCMLDAIAARSTEIREARKDIPSDPYRRPILLDVISAIPLLTAPHHWQWINGVSFVIYVFAFHSPF